MRLSVTLTVLSDGDALGVGELSLAASPRPDQHHQVVLDRVVPRARAVVDAPGRRAGPPRGKVVVRPLEVTLAPLPRRRRGARVRPDPVSGRGGTIELDGETLLDSLFPI